MTTEEASDTSAPADDRVQDRAKGFSGAFDLLVAFIASGSILVLEILAGRMLAPYVGVSLQSYTGAIGAILAGIALGAWAGGRLADRWDARRLPALMLMLGGALSLCTVPAVRFLGERTDAWGWSATTRILVLCLTIFLPPAAVLSAVAPCLVKAALKDLARAGSVVGRYSAVGTAGALVGTFATGFIFIAAWPVPTIVYCVGAALMALGVAKAVTAGSLMPQLLPVVALLGVMAAASSSLAASRCDTYTVYFCARIIPNAETSTSRLVLDNATHSEIDVNRPEVLISPYAQQIGAAIETLPPGPLRVLVLGAGGMAIPRHLSAVRPGTLTTVLEIDPALIDLVREEYLDGLPEGVDVVLGDARLTIEQLEAGSFDVVIGDAFSTLTVPWHLTTREFSKQIERVLRPDGLYLMNLIELHEGRFLRSEFATLSEVFPTVRALGPPGSTWERVEGNLLLLASGGSLDAAVRSSEGAELVPAGSGSSRADVLSDEWAPVDQWYTG